MTDDAWRYPLLAGLVSASYTGFHYWQSSSNVLHMEAVFVAGLLGGVLYHGREAESRRVGLRTGVVSALPVLWKSLDAFTAIFSFTQPAWFSVVQVVLVLALTGFGVALSALLGMGGALLGEWLAGKIDGFRPSAVGN
ncbi:DUF5518 domain-containing protein [Halopelagius fulvigenes]|uniref:DUF5518 domain-containing protein n=1 Tax=Halopelagius fulvigenes TaxID=1198324 RepID=A0ABD5TWU7_9EURY